MSEKVIEVNNINYIIRRSVHDKSVLFELLDLHEKTEIARLGLFIEDKSTANVLILTVCEEHRDEGIAKSLLDYSAKNEGIKKLTGTSLHRSISFWEHIGATFIEGRTFELYLR